MVARPHVVPHHQLAVERLQLGVSATHGLHVVHESTVFGAHDEGLDSLRVVRHVGGESHPGRVHFFDLCDHLADARVAGSRGVRVVRCAIRQAE